jgi:hypothetical protein
VYPGTHGAALHPGMPPLRDARILLDAGSLRTMDIKAVKGIVLKSDSVAKFYFEAGLYKLNAAGP